MKRMISLSGDVNDFNDFLLVIQAILLDVEGNDITSLRSGLKKASAGARRFAKQHGITQDFNLYFNKFTATGSLEEDDLVLFGRALATARDSVVKDIDLSHAHVTLFKDTVSYMRTPSDNSWNRLVRNSKIIGNPELTALWAPGEDSTKQEHNGVTLEVAVKKLRILAPKLTRKAGEIFMNRAELTQARLENPEVFKEYSKYLSVLNKIIKSEIFNMVRNSGRTRLPITEIADKFKQKGIPHNLPLGFTGGQIDEDFQYYTAEGRKLSQAPSGKVRMNPNYDPEKDDTYVLHDLAIKSLRYRTETFLIGNTHKRHNDVAEFIADEEQHVLRWRQDLQKKGSREQVLAAMVELLYTTSARVGGIGNKANGEATYGLTTLLPQHIKFSASKIEFDYAGKKGTSQYTVYRLNTPQAKKVAEILKPLVQGKASTDLVFSFGGKPLLRQAVAQYLKSIGIQLNPHKFRTIAGTKLATDILKSAPFQAGGAKQAEVERWFKESMKAVGEKLHHRNGENITGTTAIKSYISPMLMSDYFTNLKLRVPKWVPKVKSA